MKNKNYPIKRTGSQDNERYQINKVLGDVLDTLERASDWDAAASWGDHRTANYASEEDAILSGVNIPTSITLSYTRDTLPNGTDIARIRAQWTRVTSPEFVYDLEIRERDIDAGNTNSSPLGDLYSVPIISNTEGGSIAAYESEFKLGKNYQFRIRIRQNNVISPWSDYFDIDTERDATAPGGGNPGDSFGFNLQGQAKLLSAELNWTAPPTSNLAAYELNRTVSGNTTTVVLAPTATRFTDSGLEPDTTYSYTIRAISYEGVSTGVSNTVNIAPVDYITPSVPTGLSATSRLVLRDRGAQLGEFTYSWNALTAVSDPNINNINGITYEIEISTSGVVQDTVSVSSNTSIVKHTFVGEVEATYSCRVRARNVTKVSNWSAPVAIIQDQDTSSPGNVSGLAATGFPGTVDLRWTNPENKIINAIDIERREFGVGAYTTIATVAYPADDYVDVNVTVGTTYEYRVRAKSAADPVVFGNYSTVQSATPLEPGFIAPTTTPILSVSSEIRTLLTGTQVALYTVSWTRFVGDNFTYDLQVREGSLGGVVQDLLLSNPADGTTVSYQFTGETDRTYCFRARARNATTVGSWSSQICRTQGNDASAPGNISGLSAIGIYQGALLNWSIPGFLGTNYSHVEIYRRVQGDVSSTKVADVSRPMEHYFDEGLDLDTTYEYRLRPISFAGVAGNYTVWTAVSPLNVPVGSIETVSISDNAITAPLIAANAVIADKIAANAITSDKINANAVTADKINVNNLQAVSTQTGTITANQIRTAAFPAQRLEITDPGADSNYAMWSGQSTKNDTNARFWLDHAGNAQFKGRINSAQLEGPIFEAIPINVTGDTVVNTSNTTWETVGNRYIEVPTSIRRPMRPFVSLVIPVFGSGSLGAWVRCQMQFANPLGVFGSWQTIGQEYTQLTENLGSAAPLAIGSTTTSLWGFRVRVQFRAAVSGQSATTNRFSGIFMALPAGTGYEVVNDTTLVPTTVVGTDPGNWTPPNFGDGWVIP
jgi:hypothetical protein